MTDSSSKTSDISTLDQWTGGAFSAPTSGERIARLRDWLQNQPNVAQLQSVVHEMSGRDKGAAKVVRERLDELRRLQDQDALVQVWAAKGEALRDAPHFVIGDALAWQRDAAKAGAPLSREPLASLKTALAERVKAIEDLQHQAQVEREAAVLLAQRIEVLSTKSWQDALAQREAVHSDLMRWQGQVQALTQDAQWASVDPKFTPALQASAQQVQAVWDAFDAALTVTQAAAADPAAPLPAVPAWADQIRVARGEGVAQAAPAKPDAPRIDSTRTLKPSADKAVVDAQRLALCERAEALFKLASPSAIAAEAPVPKTEVVRAEVPAVPAAQAPVAQTPVADVVPVVASAPDAPDASATDALSEATSSVAVSPEAASPEAVAEPAAASPAQDASPVQAEAVPSVPDAPQVQWLPVVTGRKLQDSLRQLREEWKKIDKEAAPNPALWKRFDTACNRAHAVVDAWLKEVRAQSSKAKAERLALIDEVKAWTATAGQGPDWKGVARQLHQFSQRWREGGHLSEKLFNELQQQWKTVIHAAHEPLEAAQKATLARRRALIDEAHALAAEPRLRIDAVKHLQHRWQEESQTVPLDRRQEQKLWDAFRQPLDQAFARKPAPRERVDAAPLSAHDRAVLQAAKALDAAVAGGDAATIRAAMAALEAVSRGDAAAGQTTPAVQPAVAKPAAQQAASDVSDAGNAAQAVDASAAPQDTPADAAPDSSAEAQTEALAGASAGASADAPAPTEPVAKAPAAPRPVVAVRGDDRPGQKRSEPMAAARGRDGKPRAMDGRDRERRGTDRFGDRGDDRAPRGPRLGDAAFRAQRHALESAQMALRKFAAQAHGEVLTQLLQAWAQRDANLLPTAQALGSRLAPTQRAQWGQALQAAGNGELGNALLRLEMAADLPTPAAHQSERRALQLQLLTRRNDPSPAQTWPQDVAQVLGSAHDEGEARRLLAALKVLLKK